MGLGNLDTIRGLAGALALLGILLFTALVPGHIVSQATALAFGGDAESAAEMPCHDETAMPDATDEPKAPDLS